MSTRALRKAQKELEERQHREELAQQEESEDDDVAPPVQKPSLFALLGETEQDDEEEEEEDNDHLLVDDEPESKPKPVSSQPKPGKRNKKKKKKGKGKAKSVSPAPQKSQMSSKMLSSGMDEIDAALLALDIRPGSGEEGNQQGHQISEELQQLCAVLAVDAQHLQPANEMRKLFGRAAVQGLNREDEGGRRRGRGHPQGGVAGAVAGRNAPGSRHGPSLALRKNIFMQGKEEWPRATTGGLGMEVVSKNTDGTVEYRFVHNKEYQNVQGQFEVCVASMDPDRMVHLLQFNRKLTSCDLCYHG